MSGSGSDKASQRITWRRTRWSRTASDEEGHGGLCEDEDGEREMEDVSDRDRAVCRAEGTRPNNESGRRQT